MAKLLFQPSSRSRARLLVSLICTLFFLQSCAVKRDPETLRKAAAQNEARLETWKEKQFGKPAAPAANGANPLARPAKPSSPIIVDDDSEAPFQAVYKNNLAQNSLPPLTPESNSKARSNTHAGTAKARLVAADAALRLDSSEVAYGTEVRGTVSLAPGADALRLLWVDEAGRVAAAMDIAQPGAFVFKMPPGTFGHQHKLALVRVPKNGPPQALAVENLHISETLVWDDYVVLSSDGTAEKLFPASAARLELALQRDENPLHLPNWEMRSATYSTSRDPKLFIRQPPIFDEATIQKTAASVAKNMTGRAGALSIWSLGDGADLSNQSAPFDYDMSPETLEYYRIWLQDRYGSLKTLNAQWKSNYESWDKIVPPTTDELKGRLGIVYSMKLGILKKGDPDNKLERRGDDPSFSLHGKELRIPGNENASSWADFRAFNDFAFARLLREMRKMTADADPKAQTGLTNAQPPSAWGGWDYQNIARSVDWIEEHGSVEAREILKALAPKTHFLTASGGQEPDAALRLWDRWLRGDNGCVLPPAAVAPPAEDIHQLAGGVTLLRNSARQVTDPIAIYYSPRSIYLHWLLDSESDGSAWTVRDAHVEAARGTMNLQLKSWLLLLEDLGYAPTFIHPEQMVAGDIHYPDIKVIILPKVIALSQNEAQALRNFVESGGTLIADGECGTFDGIGKRRGLGSANPKSGGTMDNDFGIARKDFVTQERDGRFTGDAMNSRLTLRAKDGKPIGAESPELRVLEPGVMAQSAAPHATASGNQKGFLTRAFGKGRYFYLNLCLQDYAKLRAEKTAPGFKYNGLTNQAYADKFGTPTGGEALRLAVSDILDEMSGETALTVKWENGALSRGLKRSRYDLGGGAALYAILPLADIADVNGRPEARGNPLAEGALTIKAGDGKAHSWYDVQRGEFLVMGDTATVKLDPNRPALLAALPYSVDKLTLKVRRLDQSHIFKITPELAVIGGLPGTHVFHVEVFDPAGNLMPFYTVNLKAEGGTCNHQIALGINDPAGTYHVKVRDILTGKSDQGDLVKEGMEYGGLKFDAKTAQ